MHQLGLVTVLYKSDNVLKDFFKSLSIQSFKDFHLFLIDNSPSEKTDLLIKSYTNEFKITKFTHIKNEKNEGAAKGNNQGIELSIKEGTTHTLLLNNDILIEQDMLIEELYNNSNQYNRPLISPLILYYNSDIVWMAGGTISKYRGVATHCYENKKLGSLKLKDKYVNYAPTTFLLVENGVFNKVGLIDENYFAYYEDTDFLYRANKQGLKVWLMSQLMISHKVSISTGGSNSLFTIYYGNRNRMFFINKNLRGFYWIIAMVYSFATRFIKWVMYDVERRKTLIRAIVDGLKMPLKVK